MTPVLIHTSATEPVQWLAGLGGEPTQPTLGCKRPVNLAGCKLLEMSGTKRQGKCRSSLSGVHPTAEARLGAADFGL